MPVEAQLNNGEYVELSKDCDCLDHEGPHWLHENNRWRESNRGRQPTTQHGLTLLAEDESRRLADKAHYFRIHNIRQLISS